MKIKVKETRMYKVPRLLESEVRTAIELGDGKYLDELIGDIDDRVGAYDISTESVTELRNGVIRRRTARSGK